MTDSNRSCCAVIEAGSVSAEWKWVHTPSYPAAPFSCSRSLATADPSSKATPARAHPGVDADVERTAGRTGEPALEHHRLADHGPEIITEHPADRSPARAA